MAGSGGRIRSGRAVRRGAAFVLVLVMADMRGAGRPPLFVLAVHAHRRPDGLGRQPGQQENQQELAHRRIVGAMEAGCKEEQCVRMGCRTYGQTAPQRIRSTLRLIQCRIRFSNSQRRAPPRRVIAKASINRLESRSHHGLRPFPRHPRHLMGASGVFVTNAKPVQLNRLGRPAWSMP